MFTSEEAHAHRWDLATLWIGGFLCGASAMSFVMIAFGKGF